MDSRSFGEAAATNAAPSPTLPLQARQRNLQTHRLNAKSFEELIVTNLREHVLTESNMRDLVKLLDEELDGVAREQRQRGLGAADRTAWTSWASRYSGSVERLTPGSCCTAAFRGCSPRARRVSELRAVVVMDATIGSILLQRQSRTVSDGNS